MTENGGKEGAVDGLLNYINRQLILSKPVICGHDNSREQPETMNLFFFAPVDWRKCHSNLYALKSEPLPKMTHPSPAVGKSLHYGRPAVG